MQSLSLPMYYSWGWGCVVLDLDLLLTPDKWGGIEKHVTKIWASAAGWPGGTSARGRWWWSCSDPSSLELRNNRWNKHCLTIKCTAWEFSQLMSQLICTLLWSACTVGQWSVHSTLYNYTEHYHPSVGVNYFFSKSSFNINFNSVSSSAHITFDLLI